MSTSKTALEWRMALQMSNTVASVTNAVAIINVNGTLVTNGATEIDFIAGTNIVITNLLVNTNGKVAIGIHSGINTNIFIKTLNGYGTNTTFYALGGAVAINITNGGGTSLASFGESEGVFIFDLLGNTFSFQTNRALNNVARMQDITNVHNALGSSASNAIANKDGIGTNATLYYKVDGGSIIWVLRNNTEGTTNHVVLSNQVTGVEFLNATYDPNTGYEVKRIIPTVIRTDANAIHIDLEDGNGTPFGIIDSTGSGSLEIPIIFTTNIYGYSNQLEGILVNGGITLGGVRRTTWPTGGGEATNAIANTNGYGTNTFLYGTTIIRYSLISSNITTTNLDVIGTFSATQLNVGTLLLTNALFSGSVSNPTASQVAMFGTDKTLTNSGKRLDEFVTQGGKGTNLMLYAPGLTNAVITNMTFVGDIKWGISDTESPSNTITLQNAGTLAVIDSSGYIPFKINAPAGDVSSITMSSNIYVSGPIFTHNGSNVANQNWVSNKFVALPGGTNGNPGQIIAATATGQAWSNNVTGAGGPTTSNNIPTTSVTTFGTLLTNVMFDANTATVFYWTVTNNCYFRMTNGSDGQTVTLRITQDATGNRVLNGFEANAGGANTNLVRFGTDITGITLTTNAAKTDYIRLQYYKASDYWDVLGFVRGY